MGKLNLYFKVFGLAEDKDGRPAYAGVTMCLGKAKEGVQYSDVERFILSKPDWKKQFLQFCHLESSNIKENDIEMITPEEYSRDYGGKKAEKIKEKLKND